MQCGFVSLSPGTSLLEYHHIAQECTYDVDSPADIHQHQRRPPEHPVSTILPAFHHMLDGSQFPSQPKVRHYFCQSCMANPGQVSLQEEFLWQIYLLGIENFWPTA